ncbi:LGFP repeat-containing protein, partial [Kineococcus glutinatus]|uniref:LGFP repeat-containing protein n=1 Tax=Kineococcus glutinatus TaxID=1070872 RepID=UPI003CD06468
WQPYTGSNPHTDHVHVSLTRRGGRAETSWWTGAVSPIAGHWVRLGGERSVLGPAVGGERPFNGGTRQDYRSGSILVSRGTLAQEVHGLIAARYLAGDNAATLGMPVTDELPTPRGTGRFNHFQRGSIYWSKPTGARVVRGAIRDAWARQGWEAGPLGFPTSDEHAVSGGRRSDFQGGALVYSWSTGQVTTLRR